MHKDKVVLITGARLAVDGGTLAQLVPEDCDG
jgi:hypothetical protein